MTGIIIVGAIGLICAILLVVASHFLSVPIDTRVEDIRGFLPGANCGACGYAGCDDYAKAVANGSAKPNLCIPGGQQSLHPRRRFRLRSDQRIPGRRGGKHRACQSHRPLQRHLRKVRRSRGLPRPRHLCGLRCPAPRQKNLRLRLPGLWRLRQGLQIRRALHRGWRCPCG